MNLAFANKSVLVFLLVLLALPAMGNTGPTNTPHTPESRAMQLQNRLEEIKTIDRRMLSHGEKKHSGEKYARSRKSSQRSAEVCISASAPSF